MAESGPDVSCMAKSWWKLQLSGVTHGWLHELLMAHSWTPASRGPWTFDPVTLWYPFIRNAGWFVASLHFSFPAALVFTRGFCELADPSLLTP